ncbi:NUDIX domain-containing protein [Agrobacterium rubi]|nr:NUDIX domain-containing protein [Agrobacterium rubi]NTF24187.1 NUDIX domain-containing protein [Agrobacterium rubi]
MTVVAKFWGERGAGCLIRAADTGRILIGLRSAEVDDPLTWGTWGGEVDPGESVDASVVREVLEETGYDGPLSLDPLFTYRHASGFIYDTFMATVPHEFEPSLCWETEEARWLEEGHWPAPLHFGLEAVLAARPELRRLQRRSLFETGLSVLRRIRGVRHVRG